MFALHSLGNAVLHSLGTRRFLHLYLLSGITSSVTSLLGKVSSDVPSVGASGAIFGVFSSYAFLYPNHQLSLLGIINARAPVFVAGFILLDFSMLLFNRDWKMDSAGHLGGAMYGAYFAKRVLRL
eukprot:TRINITY_DN46166_c0_g1_i2.p1 TRINITY_DN46166_c0_g1~~TRINITY_DN46166_c0_g1_i2.p1  ORF type:complete len:125 (+),score=25.86 TRINITY_DN46166_c0_g1_i2:431-805(+)